MTDPVRIIVADVLAGLAQLADQSVHCCVTSPPYWGLRDYGTATWEGGDAGCEHKPKVSARSSRPRSGLTGGVDSIDAATIIKGDCHCGARRVDQQIGLEPTPEAFVARMVEVFAEVRRVLRDDGTLWLNLGDSYAGSVGSGNRQGMNGSTLQGSRTYGRGCANPDKLIDVDHGLKPKDLCMMPWRVALALQADGWYLRSVIVWHKRSPMPESVTDRPTSSWEPIFLLAKSERYFYDAEAVREDAVRVPHAGQHLNGALRSTGPNDRGGSSQWEQPERVWAESGGRNQRNVWTLGPEPYPEAHFATFPSEIPRRAIKAGCPKDGVVLDPFLGSGTTIAVARELGRRGIGIELNPAYAELARIRIGKTEKPSTFQDPRIKDSPLFTEAL